MSNFAPKSVEYNGTKRIILVGSAKLVAPLSTKTLEYTNASGAKKEYKLATIEIVAPNGKTTEMLASVAKRNIESATENNGEFAVGASYLTSIDRVEDRNNPGKFIMLARLSHLRGVNSDLAVLAELDSMFGDFEEEVAATATPKLQEVEE